MAEYITVEVPMEDTTIEVELEVHATYGNRGIGSYEFWGMQGRDDKYDWELEYLGWDSKKYTAEQNKVIEDYTIDNEDKILNQYIKIAEERSIGFFDYDDF